MHPGMITDKGVFDAVWCPVMWMDEQNDTNRVKPERDYDPLQSIYEALFTGIHSKWVFIESADEGIKALPYGDSFWLHIPFSTGKFLLTAHQVIWNSSNGSAGIVTVIRNKKYDPRDDEAVEAEKYLQVLMVQHVFRFFSEVDQVRVVSCYPGYPDQETVDPTSLEVDTADDWANQIMQQKRGTIQLVPRLEKCHNCWWMSCPARKIDPIVPSIRFKGGKSHVSGVLE
jgi:hypothetical protein